MRLVDLHQSLVTGRRRHRLCGRRRAPPVARSSRAQERISSFARADSARVQPYPEAQHAVDVVVALARGAQRVHREQPSQVVADRARVRPRRATRAVRFNPSSAATAASTALDMP